MKKISKIIISLALTILSVFSMLTLTGCSDPTSIFFKQPTLKEDAVLAPNFSWYKGKTEKTEITKIEIYDKYSIKGKLIKEGWCGDVNGLGGVVCYVLRKEPTLIIAGNGSGKITCNANSILLFGGENYQTSFYNVKSITGLDVLDTSNVKSLAFAFNYCSSLGGELDLSSWDLSKVVSTRAMFQCTGQTAKKKLSIILPQTLRVYDDFMFNHNASHSGSSFTINKNIVKIGNMHTWYDFGTRVTKNETGGEISNTTTYCVDTPLFNEFIVDSENEYFKAVDGILYDKNGTRLIAIPSGKVFENKTFEIPEGITHLNELGFSRTKQIESVILPNSYQIILDFNPNDYKDYTINYGNSLNVSIYSYTTIGLYLVKPDNPNYASYNGCIYSKDGSTLLAVPSSYSGGESRVLQIKEGTISINKHAFWGETFVKTSSSEGFGFSATKIIIPASVTSINDEQIYVLNERLLKADSEGNFLVTIEIDENNQNYMVVENQIVKIGEEESNS